MKCLTEHTTCAQPAKNNTLKHYCNCT